MHLLTLRFTNSDHRRARTSYEKILDNLYRGHVKIWISFAQFEANNLEEDEVVERPISDAAKECGYRRM